MGVNLLGLGYRPMQQNAPSAIQWPWSSHGAQCSSNGCTNTTTIAALLKNATAIAKSSALVIDQGDRACVELLKSGLAFDGCPYCFVFCVGIGHHLETFLEPA